MRTGYKPFIQALAWIRSQKGRDLTQALGGVMGPGRHKVTIMEVIGNTTYEEVLMKNTDQQVHKERCYGRARGFYFLGKKYKITLDYSKEGEYRIESKQGVYELVHMLSGRAIFRSDRIVHIYDKIRANKYKLRYLRVVWADQIDETKEL